MLTDNLILGSNSFTGTSHFSSQMAREKLAGLSDESIVAVIDAAIESGATAINLSPGKRLYRVLSLMKTNGYEREFGVYLMLPDLERFRDAMLNGGTVAVMKEVFSELGWVDRFAVAAHGANALMSSDYTGLLETYLGLEIRKLKRILPHHARLDCIMSHEQMTDLAIGLDANQLLGEFAKLVPKYGAVPGFVTRNFPLFVRYLEKHHISAEEAVIMTPFNKLGYQMVPSRGECERALNHLASRRVVAMSVFAGGRLGLEEGMGYLRSLRGIDSIVVGTSSVSHARESFGRLRHLF